MGKGSKDIQLNHSNISEIRLPPQDRKAYCVEAREIVQITQIGTAQIAFDESTLKVVNGQFIYGICQQVSNCRVRVLVGTDWLNNQHLSIDGSCPKKRQCPLLK